MIASKITEQDLTCLNYGKSGTVFKIRKEQWIGFFNNFQIAALSQNLNYMFHSRDGILSVRYLVLNLDCHPPLYKLQYGDDIISAQLGFLYQSAVSSLRGGYDRAGRLTLMIEERRRILLDFEPLGTGNFSTGLYDGSSYFYHFFNIHTGRYSTSPSIRTYFLSSNTTPFLWYVGPGARQHIQGILSWRESSSFYISWSYTALGPLFCLSATWTCTKQHFSTFSFTTSATGIPIVRASLVHVATVFQKCCLRTCLCTKRSNTTPETLRWERLATDQ